MALDTKQSVRPNVPASALRRKWLRRLSTPIWPQRSIRARLQLSHLFTSLVPLITLGFALLYTSAQAERRVFEQTQASVASSIARSLTDDLNKRQGELLNFGRTVRIRSSDLVALKNSAREYLNRQYPEMLELSIVDLQGDEVVRVNQERTYFDNELVNRSDEPFFQVGRQSLTHFTVVEAFNGSKAVQQSVPARNGVGQNTGVIVAQLRTKDILDSLSAIPKDTGRSAFVIDSAGNVMLGSPPATVADSADLRAWAATQSMATTFRGSDGKQVTAARAPVMHGEWTVVIEQPSEIAFRASRRNTWLLALVLLATGIFVGVWAVLLARELTRPIVQLRDGVQSLASGHLGGTIPVLREDELGQLASEFNGMSARLAESQRAIEQRNTRLSEGLSLARVIQRELLPQGPPAVRSIAAHAASEPAIEIGGDFYTYVLLPDGRLRLVIGDASGKGVAAALVMALTSSLVEIHARQADGPADLLMRLNAELYPRFSTSHMCVALEVAEFDPETREVCVANAGMIAPLVAAADACFYMASYGPPLGVVEDVQYDETTIVLEPEQAIIFISDGIVEARDAANEMWGFARLEQTVCGVFTGGPSEIIGTVLAALKQHVRDTPATDDMTIIAATLTAQSKDDHAYALVPAADPVQSSRKPAADQLH